MALRSWWLQTKLGRIESRLKRLRAQQRQLREKHDDERRRKLTHEVSKLLAEEERIKRELAAEADRAHAAGGAGPKA